MSAAGTLVAGADAAEQSSFSFVQISDSHIGFTRPENPDVRGTLAKTIDGINALPQQPAFVMHTGDVTHLSKPAQFDDAKSVLGTLRAPLLTVPGEHDVIGGSDRYLAAFGRAENPRGWFAFASRPPHRPRTRSRLREPRISRGRSATRRYRCKKPRRVSKDGYEHPP